jgi:hypothetical protein
MKIRVILNFPLSITSVRCMSFNRGWVVKYNKKVIYPKFDDYTRHNTDDMF